MQYPQIMMIMMDMTGDIQLRVKLQSPVIALSDIGRTSVTNSDIELCEDDKDGID